MLTCEPNLSFMKLKENVLEDILQRDEGSVVFLVRPIGFAKPEFFLVFKLICFDTLSLGVSSVSLIQ